MKYWDHHVTKMAWFQLKAADGKGDKHKDKGEIMLIERMK